MISAADRAIDGLRGALVAPGLIDLILVFTVLEGLVLGLLRQRTAVRPSVAALGLMLLPGICLLLAVRAALAGAAWPWVPAALAAALISHLADLHSRWRGR